MSYIINKTDGTVLTTIIDGKIDQNSTGLTLIGKSANAYGEYINENIVHLLENFANSTQPSKSIKGQLWYDTIEGRLKVYDGFGYKVTGGTIVAPTLPSSIAQGDIWISSKDGQLWFNDGNSTILAGPQNPAITGFEVVTLYGDDQNPYVVIKVMIDSKIVALLSNNTFTLAIQDPDYPYLMVNQGINLVSQHPGVIDEIKPLITNIRTSDRDYDAVNNDRLRTAIKQLAPFAISLDISGLHTVTDTAKHEKISLILARLYPITDFNVGDSTIFPKCRVLCTDGTSKTVRTFQLTSADPNSPVVWTQIGDIIDVSAILENE